jgi:tyrosyl-tRNA synthetase
VKEDLAKEIVVRYHGRAAAEHEAREFIRVLRERELPEEIEEVSLIRFGATTKSPGAKRVEAFDLPHIMVAIGTAASTSEARRLIKQGAVRVNGKKVDSVDTELSPGGSHLLQVGKRRFKKVTVAD